MVADRWASVGSCSLKSSHLQDNFKFLESALKIKKEISSHQSISTLALAQKGHSARVEWADYSRCPAAFWGLSPRAEGTAVGAQSAAGRGDLAVLSRFLGGCLAICKFPCLHPSPWGFPGLRIQIWLVRGCRMQNKTNKTKTSK